MIGKKLNHYEVTGRLGKGGMGEVYVARDSKLNRSVALKVLPSELAADGDRRVRFEREAQAVAALNHPNIVTIFSVEEAPSTSSGQGVHFITMERVEGKTLTELIPQKGLAINKLLEIAVPLADAISSAHRAGITHRDLKPDNVMIDGEGRLRVLDFGLAKLSDSSDVDGAASQLATKTAVTEEGKILGTVAYMSPEQAEGKAVDARTDIFSLGTMLFELATGQRPFQGETSMSTISSILKDSPQSITELNASLPRDLVRIVRRCLAKEPDRRYQTSLDLRNELEELKQQIDSGEITTVAHPATPVRRSSRTWALLAVAAAAVIAVTFMIAKMTGGPSSQPESEIRQVDIQRLMTEGEPISAAISPDGRYVAHANRHEDRFVLSVTQISTMGNIELVVSESEIQDVAFGPEGEFVYYRPGMTLFRVPKLGGHPTRVLAHVKESAVSPDGRRVAFVPDDYGANEALFVANLDGTDRQEIHSGEYSAVGFPAWSPDGARVSFVTASGVVNALREVSATGGKQTLLGERWENFAGVAWVPDGSRLILAGADGWHFDPQALWEVSYPTGRASRITTDLGSFRGVSISADGLRLATVRSVSHSKMWIVSTAEGVPPRQILSGSGQSDHFGVNWMSDGRILYGSDASGNADCWIMNADGSAARRLTSDPAADFSPVATPDGESIVFVSNRSGDLNLWTMRLDGSAPQQLTDGGFDLEPDVSPDGRWVVYNCGIAPAAVCRIPIDGGEAKKLTQDQILDGTMGPAISPDGSRIAYSTADGTEIISIDGGALLGSQSISLGLHWNVLRWTPDGQHLTTAWDGDDGGPYNIWTQQVGGGNEAQRTFLDQPDDIRAFAWSPDGRQLVVATGRETSDVVLLEGF